MRIVEIDLPALAQYDHAGILLTIERVCLAESLTLTLRGTLASYPGCIHWHFKQSKTPGTLELTWWPARHRLWFKVAGGRSAAWIDACLPQLKTKLEQALLK